MRMLARRPRGAPRDRRDEAFARGKSEKTIGPGSIVAFTGDTSGVVYALWNFHYENRVIYVPSGPDFAARVNASNATWVYTSGSERDELISHGFVELGPLVNGDGNVVLRRADW